MQQIKNIIQIQRTETKIIVQSPYNSLFVEQARKLAGKFKDCPKRWEFDIRDEAEVLEACYLHYGEDGIRNDKCNVQITFHETFSEYHGALTILGYPLARAFNRDSGAKVGDGVLIKEGGFDSGGSMKNWTTKAYAGTVIVLRDISKPLVQLFIDENRYDPEAVTIEILEEYSDLAAEKAKLLARVAEIDAQLNAQAGA